MFESQTEGRPRCKVAFVTEARSFPQLDIVQQEYIHESGLQQFEVVNAAFDASGNWLATVEERKQKTAELELNLKLWAFDEQTQRYESRHTTDTCPCYSPVTCSLYRLQFCAEHDHLGPP